MEKRLNEIRVLDKALNILLSFSREQPELSLTDLVQQLKVPKATVYRIATVLTRQGLLGQNEENRKYHLGGLLVALSGLVPVHQDVKDAATMVMQELGQTTGEGLNLSVAQGMQRLCIGVIDSRHDIRLFAHVGQLTPLHAGASAKTLLAFMPPERIEAVIAAGLQTCTDSTLVDPDRLRANLAQIRLDGYAVSESERVVGAASIAAPIRSASGMVIASISLGGPNYRITRDRYPTLVPLLVNASLAISSRLGYATLASGR